MAGVFASWLLFIIGFTLFDTVSDIIVTYDWITNSDPDLHLYGWLSTGLLVIYAVFQAAVYLVYECKQFSGEPPDATKQFSGWLSSAACCFVARILLYPFLMINNVVISNQDANRAFRI